MDLGIPSDLLAYLLCCSNLRLKAFMLHHLLLHPVSSTHLAGSSSFMETRPLELMASRPPEVSLLTPKVCSSEASE